MNNSSFHSSWLLLLENDLKQPYMEQIRSNLRKELQKYTIYPPLHQIMTVFNHSFDSIKVVILGQDPYHAKNQAHGLSFSVLPGNPIPPSLVNIYKELNRDIEFQPPKHGYLKYWSDQGVFLLNTSLSVRKSQPGSHKNIGWTTFTDRIIKLINQNKEHIVFLLWGNHAQSKIPLIDQNKHLVLSTSHPSPFSVHRGFLGCGHFSKTNQYLKEKKNTPIDWSLPNLEEIS